MRKLPVARLQLPVRLHRLARPRDVGLLSDVGRVQQADIHIVGEARRQHERLRSGVGRHGRVLRVIEVEQDELASVARWPVVDAVCRDGRACIGI